VITISIKPARRIFSGRNQWKFEIRAANGEPIDPRDTYANRGDIETEMDALIRTDPVELVFYDRNGNIEQRRVLRG
jgi:hypothetical protein